MRRSALSGAFALLPPMTNTSKERPVSCYITDDGAGIICGNLGPHCQAARCGRIGDLLCDFPVGDGKTCDRPLCEHHAVEVAPDMHYCPAHLLEWERFRESGGVREELANVVPYKTHPKELD